MPLVVVFKVASPSGYADFVKVPERSCACRILSISHGKVTPIRAHAGRERCLLGPLRPSGSGYAVSRRHAAIA